MASIFYPGHTRATDNTGAPLSGAKWYFYATGTTEDAAAYQDSALATPHAQPVLADAYGKFPQIFLDPSVTYRAQQWDADDAVQYDDIDPANTPDTSSVSAAAAAQTAQDAANTATDAASAATDAIAAVSAQAVGESSITFGLGNLLGDDEFADAAVWTLPTGWAFDASSIVTATMKANNAIASVAGNGSTAQGETEAKRASGRLYRIRPSAWYYAVVSAAYPASYAGRAKLRMTYYRRDGVTVTGSASNGLGTDYTGTANGGAAVTETIECFAKSPSDAYYLQVSYVASWPTSINSAGYAYFGRPRVTGSKQSLPGALSLGPAKIHTIAAGVITLDSSTSNIVLDTEGNAGTDDLDTINGGEDGMLVILRTNNSSRDVTVKDGTGNINLAGDQTLSGTADRILLVCVGANWFAFPIGDNA